jgi:DNA-binding MarR family transcriptional regulator
MAGTMESREGIHPTALDPALLERAAYAYSRAMTVLDPVRLEDWDARGVTLGQLRLLYILFAEGNVPVGYLAERMGVRPSTVTGMMNRLSRQRLIRRRTDPRDRRVVRVELTPAGREAVCELSTAATNYLGELLARLPQPTVERLVEGLEALVDAARARQQEGRSTPRDADTDRLSEG